MAATRACLVALVVALTFLFMEGRVTAEPTSAGSLVQRRREMGSLLRRLNKPPIASIQMRPSYNPRGMHHDSNITTHAITQIWHQNGMCPENTIPIRRTKEEDLLRASSIRRFGKKMPRSIPHLNPTNDTDTPNILRGHQVPTMATASIPLKRDGRFIQIYIAIAIQDYSSTGLVMHINQQDVTTYCAQASSKQAIRSQLAAVSPQCPPMVAHNMTSIF
uniref:Neprosin activation peptide domain-containing protein n=1 Tax=Aegilops tauschii subsp. strangulata TaxID=200361 RepID=A0A453MJJ5_AEGTS